MFNPSRDQVRRFFCEAWARSRAGQPVQAIGIVPIDFTLDRG